MMLTTYLKYFTLRWTEERDNNLSHPASPLDSKPMLATDGLEECLRFGGDDMLTSLLFSKRSLLLLMSSILPDRADSAAQTMTFTSARPLFGTARNRFGSFLPAAPCFDGAS